MFASTESVHVAPVAALAGHGPQSPARGGQRSDEPMFRPVLRQKAWDGAGRIDRPSDQHAGNSPDRAIGHDGMVAIAPADSVTRRSIAGTGLKAELVEATGRDRIEFRFRASTHLLVAYEEGMRRDGATSVAGMPQSTLRDFARKLTFVPAGHEFHEWHTPRSTTRIVFVYFDPAVLAAAPAPDIAAIPPAARVFFEDAALWSTTAKLKRLVEQPSAANRLYFEALGVVLAHELDRLNRGLPRAEPQIRGGLAAWQQRTVAAYIEEHLAEQIPLATLAQLARLSPYYFCRAFKQSFGLPPHRYHTNRRIERAKVLLAKRACSVTEIGLSVGFSESSSFATAFRKATGVTPSGYHRHIG